jgi:hypothetical protein
VSRTDALIVGWALLAALVATFAFLIARGRR